MLKAVILDVDGTLVDSNDAHAHAWVEALAEHGLRVEFETVRRAIGMGSDKLLPHVVGISSETDDGKRISERRSELFLERFVPHLVPCRGSRELLRRMHDDRLKLVVASSAQKKELKALLQIAGADEFIAEATSSDDADRSKPDPDIVRAALKEAGARSDEVVMVGDTPYDVEAAARASVAIIALRCGGWGDSDLKGAVAIYDDPADLLAHYDKSPLGQRLGVAATREISRP
jgi:HAD superfamily hydrolase (TIGR01509 family)